MERILFSPHALLMSVAQCGIFFYPQKRIGAFIPGKSQYACDSFSSPPFFSGNHVLRSTILGIDVFGGPHNNGSPMHFAH